MALDIYAWLTYRMSYLREPTTIPWEALQMQFGADYSTEPQGLRDFRRGFRKALRTVLTVYLVHAEDADEKGVILRPGVSHVTTRKPTAQEHKKMLKAARTWAKTF